MRKINLNINQKVLYTIVCVLSISVLTLTIAYASLSSNLTITGSADVVAATWDIHFENAKFVTAIPSYTHSDDSASSTNYKMPQATVSKLVVTGCTMDDCIGTFSGTTGSFVTTSISKPGDFKAIQFDVVNAGSIDAELDGFVLSGLSTEQDVYLNYYVQYSDGTSITSGDILTAGTSETLLLVIEFDDSITSSQLPTEDQKLSLSFTMNYIQN